MRKFSLHSTFSTAYRQGPVTPGQTESIVKVAEGVEFTNGRCAVCFLHIVNHVFTHRSTAELIEAFCADGRTSFRYD